jgi:hypothetical protein
MSPCEVKSPNMVWRGEVRFLERIRGQAGLEFLGYLTRWALYEDLTAIDLGIIVSPRRVDHVGQSVSGALELDFHVHCGSERTGRGASVEGDLDGRPDRLNRGSEACENVPCAAHYRYGTREETVVSGSCCG